MAPIYPVILPRDDGACPPCFAHSIVKSRKYRLRVPRCEVLQTRSSVAPKCGLDQSWDFRFDAKLRVILCCRQCCTLRGVGVVVVRILVLTGMPAWS